MHALAQIILKDLLMLARDRAGLLVLFVMPALLVVVITLVQENVLELSGQRPAEAMWWDRDQGPFAEALRQALADADLRLIDRSDESAETVREQIRQGRSQAAILLGQGTSQRLEQALARHDPAGSTAEPAAAVGPELELVFDPAAMAGFRAGLHGRVRMAALIAEIECKAALIGQRLADRSPTTVSGGEGIAPSSTLGETFRQPLVQVQEHAEHGHTVAEMLNPVNQNVPAWALFGLFFTAIPLAGTMIQERQTGIAARLRGMPVRPLTLLIGRILAYLVVCCCQFSLIVLVGRLLFPLLGLPAFSPVQPLAFLLLVILCGLAAASFGVALGALARSYEQASMLGSTLVVTAAALGGVMVPVYAMPRTMQVVSQASPLNWGVSAFTEILSRGSGIGAVTGQGLALLLFSAALLLLAWWRSGR